MNLQSERGAKLKRFQQPDVVTLIVKTPGEAKIASSHKVYLPPRKKFIYSEKAVPRNISEARDVLNMIQAEKTGSRNSYYKLTQLRAIAQNLGLSVPQDKDLLVKEIREAVQTFYNIPPEK